MYLKAIEIFGFKSFANKVKFPLKPGITCIVGPNGCGKSNVVDSIRWCIGEMSWKSLRLPSMMDVIFAGTNKRQPLNMGEVSMTFDNESRKLPLDFSEVTVTRKIYRSEESEYFINRVQCRLKDIREMFLDTGIGSDGYAIIDQGGVEFVLKATPEERREIFEEAAGVSKYKAKREEALRKLEKVDQDLARLADSMTLIDEQLKKLDADAKKARLQQKYREELQTAEIAMLAKDIRGLKAEIEKINAEAEPVRTEMQELASSMTAIEGEMAALALTLTQKGEDARQLAEAVTSLRVELTALEGHTVKNEELIRELAGQIADLEKSERSNREKLERTAPELEGKKAKLSELENGHGAMKADFEASSQALSAVEAEQAAAAARAADFSAQINASLEAEMALSKEIAGTESDITRDREDLVLMTKELETLAADKAALEGRLAQAAAAEAANAAASEAAANRLSGLKASREEALRALAAAEAGMVEAGMEKAAAEARLEAILAQGEKDSYWVGINAVLNSGIAGVRGTLRHAVTVRREDRVQAEEALGRFMDAVICDNADRAREAIEYLRHLGKGRCRFIVLDRVPQAPAAGWDASGAQRMREKISCPPEYSALLDYLVSSVYASGGSVHGPFWVTGGVDEVASNEPYWGEEGELKEKISSLLKRAETLAAEKAALGVKLSGLESELAAAEAEAEGLRMQAHTLRTEREGAAADLELKVRNIQLNSEQAARDEADMKQKEGQLEGLKARLAEAMASSESRKKELAELGAARDALSARFAALKEEIGAKRNNLENFGRNLESLREDVGRLEAFRASLAAEIEQAGPRRAELAARSEAYRAEIDGFTGRANAARSELKEKELIQRQLDEELAALRAENERLGAQLAERRNLHSEDERKLQESGLRVNTCSTRMDDLARRLADDWNTTPAEADAKYADTEVDPDRVKFMRKRLENMGAVNMTAPEEYDALINRYNFMNSQVEDLNKAKADLRSAITKINDTTRENFKNTYDKVSAHFKRIYGLLFNGGEANLVLTMPENLLETGVEIVAQPPGKKLISISQLSGGERALTALALLFSFFCVNPAPFCVLDEADAPLDEANLERFNRLIMEFAKTTQFVVITHKKRTMEVADTLFGVTMEEPGVSKVISVDLKRASAMADQAAAPAAPVRA